MLTATFVWAGDGRCWTYESGQVSDTNGTVFAATLANDVELTLTTTVSIGSPIVDFRPSVCSMDGLTNYSVVAFAANLLKNQTTIRELYLPTGIKTIGKDCFKDCSALWKLEPFFPATLTAVPYINGWNTAVTNDLKLCGPEMTEIAGSAVMWNSLITSVDMTGSSISTFGGSAFNACGGLTNIVFANVPLAFGPAKTVFVSNKLRAYRFRGDPPTFAGVDPFKDTGSRFFYFYLPKWNKKWEAFLADPFLSTISEMTSSDWSDYNFNNHGGEPVPVQKLCMRDTINDKDLTIVRPFLWWYPNPPPTYETVTWFDVLGYDSARFEAADAADATLVDGTTYVPKSYSSVFYAPYYWLCADGHAAEVSVPAACTTTRGLKLTGYRLHQLALGDWPNGRAPTAWTLSGKKLGSDTWTVIDTVTMSADSVNAWAYLKNPAYTVSSKSQTCPPRADCSLTYDVPAAAQTCYVAFKFEPTNSYNLENGIADATPFGLMELEFLGEATTPEPDVGEFAVAAAKWNEIDFAVTLSGLGEIPAQGRSATGATGWVEVYSDAARTLKVAESARVAFAAAMPTNIPVAGLSGNTAYYARLFVTNDIEGASQADVACATLEAPWVLGAVTCTDAAGEDDQYTVSVELKELYVNSAEFTLSKASSPSGAFSVCAAPVALTTTGVVAFAGTQTRESPTETLKVTVSGGATERAYTAAAAEYWIVNNASSPTSMSGSISGKRIGLSVKNASKHTLQVVSLDSLGPDGVMDLSLPIYSDDGLTQFTIVQFGANYSFAANLEITEAIFPKEVTSFVTYVLYNCPRLRKITFNGDLTDFPGNTFTGCQNLSEIVFNGAVRSFGYAALEGDVALTRLNLPDGVTSFGGSCFSGCTGLTELELPASVTTIGNDFLKNCKNIRKLIFRGDKPASCGTVLTGMAASWTALLVVPKMNETWRNYIAAHSTGDSPWITPLTAA